MNSFLRRGFKEQQRQADLRRLYVTASSFLGRVFAVQDETSRRLLMTPLIEVAWADGRVTAREGDVLVEIAGNYGLTAFEDSYCEFLESLITRRSITESSRNWFRLGKMLSRLPASTFEKVSEAITAQARFVAEQGSNNLVAILRGDGVGRDEESILRKLSSELKSVGVTIAENALRREADREKIAVRADDWSERQRGAVRNPKHGRFEEKMTAAG